MTDRVHTGPPEAEENLTEDGTVEKPINREPSMGQLISSYLTRDDNYDRNHGPVQHLLSSDHVVKIDGLVSKPMELTISQLVGQFTQHQVTAALQCAGNRRHTMRTQIKEVKGVDWFDAAIMNCVWEGPRLRDILLDAGVSDLGSSGKNEQSLHVQFASYGAKTQEDEWYGGSIPLERAMNPEMDVILAVKMNHEPLSARNGFPVRALVPGVLGARSVKWLDRITVSTQESPNFYQRHDYKVLPPNVTDAESAEKYWDKIPAMMEMPVNACIGNPVYESTIKLDSNGKTVARGYAVPQGSDGPVTRVQVSGDEGITWVDATLDYGPSEMQSKWSWVLWEAEVSMDRGENKTIYAKATDRAGNTQSQPRSEWNLRGVGYNGYEATYGLTVI